MLVELIEPFWGWSLGKDRKEVKITDERINDQTSGMFQNSSKLSKNSYLSRVAGVIFETSCHITSPAFSDSSFHHGRFQRTHSGVFRMQVAACTASKLAWHTNKKMVTRAEKYEGASASNSAPKEVQIEIPPIPPFIELRSQLRFDFLRKLTRRLMDTLSLQCEQ